MPQYKLSDDFKLEKGERLTNAHLYYETLGNPANEPIWICHALTGNATVKEWWPTLFVENGGFLDTEKHYIICANSLGSCYGSTGPTGESDFPEITHRDVVNAFEQLKDYLNIDQISMLLGGSLGGQQALEWSIIYPQSVDKLVLIGCNAKHSAWGIAWNHLQRTAINNSDDDKGLSLAREIAMLSYRSADDFEQKEKDWKSCTSENVTSYLTYQGEKFVKRFNSKSYYLLSQMMDSHNIGRERAGHIEAVLATISANCLIIGVSTDLLFPLAEQRFLSDNIPNAKLEVITSAKGHDAFLLEGNLISDFITYHFFSDLISEIE